MDLRNALAHGNQDQLAELRARGISDTVSWARARLGVLGRVAGALDHVVWDHFLGAFGKDAW